VFPESDTEDTIRRNCERRLGELREAGVIPAPFSLERLRQRIAHHRGRPLIVADYQDPAPGLPTGVTLALDDRDVVLCDPACSPTHREHVVLHEFSHIVLGHLDTTSNLTVSGLAVPEAPGWPHLGEPGRHDGVAPDGKDGERIHGDSDREKAAELLAYLISAEARRQRQVGYDAPASLRRLADLLAPGRNSRDREPA
jgi:hypothetical protein